MNKQLRVWIEVLKLKRSSFCYTLEKCFHVYDSFSFLIMTLSFHLHSDSTGNVCKSEKIVVSFEVVKSKPQKRQIPSASSALIIGAVLGIIQAIFLIAGAKPLLNFMGVKPVSCSLHKPRGNRNFLLPPSQFM